MSRAGNLRRRRNAIAEQGNKCFFCGCEMEDPSAMQGNRHHPKAATLDHLNPKLSPGRNSHRAAEKIVTPRGKKARNVASCWECNNTRNKEFQSALPLNLLHLLSKRQPSVRA